MRLDQLTRQPGAYPDWHTLLQPHADEWATALAKRDNPRVLFATSLGMHFTANAIDGLVAAALTFRGARADILLCDGALPACQMVDHVVAPSVARYAKHGPEADFCGTCFPAGFRHFSALGLDVVRLSEFLATDEKAETLRECAETVEAELNPTNPGGADEHGYAGALRFFGRALLPDSQESRTIFARYLAAARLAERSATRLFEKQSYDVVVAHHGIYAPQGAIARAARASGARLVTWHPSYRKGRVIFEHGDTYHRTMINEPPARWRDRALTPAEDRALDAYLASRMTGSQDWITFQRAAPQSSAKLEAELGLSFDKPTLMLIGNVAWDARLHYESSAYGEMTKWAADTAQWFAARPDRQLIVRCHPGEVMSSPRAEDRLEDAVRGAFSGALPPNIAIVPAESDLNTYALAAHCKAALIYNTKMGVELSARGMPVIVAGDAWIRGKGLSHDASTPEEYTDILEKAHALEPLDGRRLDEARRYAFHFFFRRCLPVSAFDPEAGWPLCALSDDAGAKLRPGEDAGLDIICKGILSGTPFEYDGALNNS